MDPCVVIVFKIQRLFRCPLKFANRHAEVTICGRNSSSPPGARLESSNEA